MRDAPPPREWPPLRLGGDDVFWFNKNCAEIDEYVAQKSMRRKELDMRQLAYTSGGLRRRGD